MEICSVTANKAHFGRQWYHRPLFTRFLSQTQNPAHVLEGNARFPPKPPSPLGCMTTTRPCECLLSGASPATGAGAIKMGAGATKWGKGYKNGAGTTKYRAKARKKGARATKKGIGNIKKGIGNAKKRPEATKAGQGLQRRGQKL